MNKPAERQENLALAHAAPRCGAQSRSGKSCRAPAMPNGRCRLHGGKSTGPRTLEGLRRICEARTVHGSYSAESVRLAEMVRLLKANAKAVLEKV